MKRAAAVLIALAVLLLLLLGGRELLALVPAFAGWVEGLGVAGAAVFVAGYVAAAVALVPGSLLTLAAGAVFGVMRGTLLVMLGATLGATAAFLVARHLARPAVERRLGRDPRVRRIDRAIARQGFRVVLLLRLSPALPFNVMNYALGLTRVRLRDYVLASAGMLPGTLLYVYYGKVAGDVAALAAGVAVPRGPEYWAVLALGLAATLALTVVVTRAARRALQEETDDATHDAPPAPR